MRTLILATALLAGAAFAKQISPECLAQIELEYWKIMHSQQHAHAVCADRPSEVDAPEGIVPNANDPAVEVSDSEGAAGVGT